MSEETPVYIDRDRMERALASPRFTMPQGLTPEQKCDLMLEVGRFSKALTDPLQAKIDGLMLEYCPEEMTPEQIEEWWRHQRPCTPEHDAEVDAVLGIVRKSARRYRKVPPYSQGQIE